MSLTPPVFPRSFDRKEYEEKAAHQAEGFGPLLCFAGGTPTPDLPLVSHEESEEMDSLKVNLRDLDDLA